MTTSYSVTPHQEPWNKGKLLGRKPPFKPSESWAIRTRLELDSQVRDLELFNLALGYD